MEADMGQIPILDKCQMQFPNYTNHVHIFLYQYLGGVWDRKKVKTWTLKTWEFIWKLMRVRF